MKRTAKYAAYALAGSMLLCGGVMSVNAESTYNSTAVAGITLSVNDYVASIEDTTAPATEASGEAAKTTSGKHKKMVLANVDNVVNVRKKGSKKSEVVGQMYKGDAGKLVKSGKTWSKIKSGNVTGWVKNDFLFFGEEAYEKAQKVCTKTATVKTTTLNVRTKKSTDAEIVTQIPKGGEYTVKKESDGWVKIMLDEDCKGYVSSDFVDVDVEYGKALTMKEIQEIEEANAAAQQAAAEQQVQQQQQTSTTTITSERSVSTIKPTKNSTITNKNSSSSSSFSNNSSVSSTSTSNSDLGNKIAQYALQFVGNPYVYGGTSLTNGTDCSGFTMSVYAHFGYGLSRTAAAQSSNGTSVSLSNLQPGDLLFYSKGGGIGHVALYIGGGRVVHASTETTGIITSAYNYRTPCKAVSIIK